jgi:hypothetical protein
MSQQPTNIEEFTAAVNDAVYTIASHEGIPTEDQSGTAAELVAQSNQILFAVQSDLSFGDTFEQAFQRARSAAKNGYYAAEIIFNHVDEFGVPALAAA